MESEIHFIIVEWSIIMRRQKFQKSKSEFMNSIYKNLNVRLICQIFLGSTFLFLISIGCQDDVVNPSEETITGTQRVGFELIQIFSADSILVWTNDEPLTQAEFNSILTSTGWAKNQPREGDPNGSSFLRSPNAASDGIFTKEKHFGYQWLFNAQIVQQNVPLPNNEDGLLSGRYIAKYHQVKFKVGAKLLYVLISPNGEEYVFVYLEMQTELLTSR
jgi:hypothetical protein